MPHGIMTGNAANVRRWAEQVEIDWFSQFIKVWIPFNAWFNNAYEDDRERLIINELKTSSNSVRGNIIGLLEQTYDEARTLKEDIARLHARLSNQKLENRGKIISFDQCYLGPSNTQTAGNTHNGLNYLVERGCGHVTGKQIYCEIQRRAGTISFNLTQPTYDLDELQANPDFQRLADVQGSWIKTHYQAIHPDRIENLLDTTSGALQIGSYQFCNNAELIFEGLLEILYSLRCLLFHGTIEPTAHYCDIYEPAYFILRRFLKSIR